MQEKDTANVVFSLFGYGLSVTVYPYSELLMRIQGSGLSRINCSELSLAPQHQCPAPHPPSVGRMHPHSDANHSGGAQ